MQKLYYSISDASKIIDEEQHILRYWEKEFDELKPRKNRGGNRIYNQKDIYLLKTIKNLLRNEKLSLKGAKEQIKKLSFDNIDENNRGLFSIQADNYGKEIQEMFLNKQNQEKKIFTINETKELLYILKDVVSLLK